MARLLCNTCDYAISTCICNAIEHTNNATRIIILQHPSEEKTVKNTAKLVALSLSNCEIIKGENNQDFAFLQTLPADTTVVLYPNDHAISLDDKCALRDLKPITHLIVIDGTWKKAFKILQLTPLLQQFKTVSFNHIPANQYSIRKASRTDSLSTLEAVAYSLNIIEGYNTTALHNLLHELIKKQTQQMPEHVKARYL